MFSPAALWEPYISGRISTVGLPCEHSDMARPDMLERVWQAVAAWLDRE